VLLAHTVEFGSQRRGMSDSHCRQPRQRRSPSKRAAFSWAMADDGTFCTSAAHHHEAVRGDVYDMRMARVNITVPDDLYDQAKRAGLNVSQLAQRAIATEVARLAKIAELDAYLAELDAELGPISDDERAKAEKWADKALGPTNRRRTA